MAEVWIIVVLIVGLLLLERLAITKLTTHPRGREWVKRHHILHPNSISLIRMPLGIVCVLLAMADCWTAAIICFTVAMISDLTDGTIARNCDLATESGKWLDPLSDKCVYFPGLIYLSIVREPLGLPGGWVALLLVTDAVGQASRAFIQKKAANHFGKAKTALITLLLAVTALNHIHPLWFTSGHFVYLLTVSCTVLAFLSFYCKVIPDSWYANSLTLANFLCGIAAIWNVHAGHPLRAFVLVFVGQFFDLFDGRLARKYGSTRHGAVFDDIADGTSFGLAIGFLVWQAIPTLPHVWLLAAFYLGCVIFRLYRFLNPATTLPRGIFQGLPPPAGAMLAGSATLLFDRLPLLAGAIVFVTSLLMVSNIRYRHFGHRIWPDLPKGMKLLILLLFLIFVNISIADKDYANSFSFLCFMMAVLYLIIGVDYPPTREEDAPPVAESSLAAEPPPTARPDGAGDTTGASTPESPRGS